MTQTYLMYESGPEATSDLRPANPLISIVIPAYNEVECLDELSERLVAVFNKRSDIRFEVIIVENGSSDGSLTKLMRLHERDPRFKVLQLSRNFGCDGGMSAGMQFATGDACVLMTADLQDPPELIHEFINLWTHGYDNVFGVVRSRGGTGPLRRFNSRLYYKLLGTVSAERMPENVSDFRLIDKSVYEVICNMPERSRFLRSMIAWTGFRSVGIPFDRPERFGGTSKANTLGVLNNAVNSILQSSHLFIKAIPVIGVLVFSISSLVEVILILDWLTRGVPFNGFGSLISLGLMSLGLVTLFLGVIGQYVWLIYEQVRERPNFVVRRVFMGGEDDDVD